MATKRMTLDRVEAARRRAVSMFENFGDSEGAAQFDNMTAQQYAEHKKIEVVHANPKQTTQRSTTTMGLKITEHEQLENYINDVAEGGLESNTRASLRSALEEISDLTANGVTLIFEEDGTVQVDGDGDDADGDDPDDEQ